MVGPMTADQASQKAFFEEMAVTLTAEWEQIREQVEG